MIHTLPGACGLSSLQDEVRTLLGHTHSARWVSTLPGRWAHSLVGACGLSSSQDEGGHSLVGAHRLWWVRTLPSSYTHSRDGRVAGWRTDRSCCCRGVPQSAPEGLFLFEKILLLNPATPYKEGPVLLHSPPLQLDWRLSGSGPHMAQLSTFPSQSPQSPWV